MKEFVCKQCGNCCQNLIIPESLYGYYISDEESKFFSKDSLQPLFKSGDKIIAWQIITSKCPSLEFINGKASCSIYENRPLTCRTFPYTEGGDANVKLCPHSKGCNSFKKEKEALKKQEKELENTTEPTEMYLYQYDKWIKR